MFEINNLNFKLKKLSILFEKNDNLLKQITEENKDLKKKNLELENQIMRNKKDINKNKKNLSNYNNSNYDTVKYINSIKKKSTPNLREQFLLSQKENDDLINKLNLQKETDKLIKENYVGNIANLKNNYLNDESNRIYNNNNSYLFKNLKKNKNIINNVYDMNNDKDYYNY